MIHSELHCDCIGPPWPVMVRLHGGAPNRYYLCRRCGAVREDVYADHVIVATHWHDAVNDRLPASVRAEAAPLLNAPQAEQLSLWGDE